MDKINLPDEYENPNMKYFKIHDQGSKNNCTSHAIAGMVELQLSEIFQESVTVNVDDLWNKQLRYGTATEEGEKSVEGALVIFEKYGVWFHTESGIIGTYSPLNGIKFFKKY
ncbi:hypothetical protein [Fusibacter ferrireducens]|uniref:Peptidase C1A papain C-terminal domain-containing protein n=1 Tax=Fusibacter ferrireducens TaxID=2785058 RepID=A0ABS0A064_9FIRM|nr:hypothetical protein [Fusibacter ferrireducens]MBF4696099.1 hypothetical protein [Fusibacter ferrireducens]